MADKTGIINRYDSLVKQLGKAALSAFYSDDFEFYLCAFELVTSFGTEAYFVFPIQPNSIQKSEPVRTNVKKSMSGITVLRNSSFVPQDINIKGNFGRRFKILSNLDGVAFATIGLNKNGIQYNKPIFSPSIKTGYGATKVLQSLLKDSNTVDRLGKPKQLYFYNMGFGESYLVSVSPSGVSFSQSIDYNMIWQYSVNMTVLAPLSDVASHYLDHESANRKILSKGAINKIANTVAIDVKRMLI